MKRTDTAATSALRPTPYSSFSAASAWEAAVKISQGKLKLPEAFGADLEAFGVERLPVTFARAKGVIDLPWHHRDPVDRLLIAQAKLENLAVVAADAVFARYGIRVIAA